MKRKLESFAMIILNSGRGDIAQYEFLPTQVICSDYIRWI